MYPNNVDRLGSNKHTFCKSMVNLPRWILHFIHLTTKSSSIRKNYELLLALSLNFDSRTNMMKIVILIVILKVDNKGDFPSFVFVESKDKPVTSPFKKYIKNINQLIIPVIFICVIKLL